MHRIRSATSTIDTFISRQSLQQNSICHRCALRLRSRKLAAPTFSTSTQRREETKRATTWEGLPWVGGEQWVNERASLQQPQPFGSRERVQDPTEIQSHLLNALVEVRLAQEAGEDLNWSVGIQDGLWPQGVQVIPSGDGNFAVAFTNETDREELLTILTGTEVDLVESENEDTFAESSEADSPELAQASPMESEKAEKLMEELAQSATQEDVDGVIDEQSDSLSPVYATATGAGWTNISLQDPELKFLLLKRLRQRLGNTIPDSRIHTISTLGQVLEVLSMKEKPKKLHDAIKDDPRILANSNVQMHQRRVTPIDKEKTIGRWKVIERELTARGLPVTGNEY